MATPLVKPVVREISPETITSILGFTANRSLVVTMDNHGITLKGKGKHGEGTLVPWHKIVSASWEGMGLEAFRKDLR